MSDQDSKPEEAPAQQPDATPPGSSPQQEYPEDAQWDEPLPDIVMAAHSQQGLPNVLPLNAETQGGQHYGQVSPEAAMDAPPDEPSR